MTEPRVRLDDLGAWLIKGNADQADLTARFAAEPLVTGWCVRPAIGRGSCAPGSRWSSGPAAAVHDCRTGVGRRTGHRRGRAGPSGQLWSVPLDLPILAARDRVPARCCAPTTASPPWRCSASRRPPTLVPDGGPVRRPAYPSSG
ncbi:hypothetical protein NKG94_11495 [Micromonospora sp. M12]